MESAGTAINLSPPPRNANNASARWDSKPGWEGLNVHSGNGQLSITLNKAKKANPDYYLTAPRWCGIPKSGMSFLVT